MDKGVAVNAQDCYGMTPLHYALRVQNADAAIALLEAGADPNIPNIDNLRPLSMVGYTKDRLDVLELMLKTEVMSIILLMIMKLFWKVGSLVPFHLNGKLIFIN
ncbi:ankyrin repeat domain-containing protein [Neisseria weixii]|uniref:ankyrin repeat domain-containing protein n=1 Tax=Neisseria weixii TaxID=1853276 RepID=UPI001E4212AB|nr:ankyrin repeat domain-containing protein [Neisseria weixii]